MEFATFSDALEIIRGISSRNQITVLLAQLYHATTPHEARIVTYLLLGQLRPPYQGPTLFNIADRSMKAIVTDILGHDTNTITHHLAQYGDLALVLAEGTWKKPDAPTLLQMYTELEELEKISGTNAHIARAKKFKQMVKLVSPREAGLLVRIVLGKLRLGFSEMTIVDALSWMITGDKSYRSVIEEAYNVTADLGLIAEEVKKYGIEKLKGHKPHVGIPILPAAAERAPSAEFIIKKIGPCIIEPKIDGFRLQIHVIHHGSQVKVLFFSRNLQPMQDMFPELEEAMKTYPHNLIVEGEAVAYDPETDTYFSFQETVKRKRKHAVSETALSHPLRLTLFDIMVYNNSPCINHTHHDRFKLLKQAILKLSSSAQSMVTVVAHQAVTTAHQIDEYFNYEVSRGFEGIMAKRDNAPYQAGKRNFTWIKLKYQEIGALDDTIDAVVLGYYRGHGKRAKFGIGSCLVGVYDKTHDRFVTLAKLGTGLSDDEWKELKKECDAFAVNQKPNNVICHKTIEPHIWIEPHIVLEVAADNITRSPIHTAGLALRFPRMVKFRFDKSATDATTTHELQSLYQNQGKKTK
jgi:DNA ligase-1